MLIVSDPDHIHSASAACRDDLVAAGHGDDQRQSFNIVLQSATDPTRNGPAMATGVLRSIPNGALLIVVIVTGSAFTLEGLQVRAASQ
jgi:hypothetical protein